MVVLADKAVYEPLGPAWHFRNVGLGQPAYIEQLARLVASIRQAVQSLIKKYGESGRKPGAQVFKPEPDCFASSAW